MNKLKILFLLFIVLFSTSSVFATSGACSSHGGVNCSAQISRYDKVICNDGWTNSSVYYYESDECQASSCTPPSGSGCKNESDYSTKQVQLNAQGGYLGFTASHAGVLQQCRNEITAYQSALQSYNSCLSNKASSSSNSSYSPVNFNSEMQAFCSELYGPNSNYTNKSCQCNSGYEKDITNKLRCVPEKEAYTNYCVSVHGSNVHIDGTRCTCNEGFVIDKNKNESCVPIDDWCIENNGPNFYGKDNKCILREEVKKELPLEATISKPTESQTIIQKPIIEKPKIVKPEVKVIPKPTETEIKKDIKIETPASPPQIQKQVEVRLIQKPSVFKRTINWFISLFN